MKETLPLQSTPKKIMAETPAPERKFAAVQNTNEPFTEGERRERIDAIKKWTSVYLEDHYPEFGPDTERDFIDYCNRNGYGNTSGENASFGVSEGQIGIGSEAAEAFLHEIIDTMWRHADDPERLERFTESLSENARFDRWGFRELDDVAFVSVYTDYERTYGFSGSDTPFALMRAYFADRLTVMDGNAASQLAKELSKRSPGERIDIIRFLPTPIPLDNDGFEPPKSDREPYRNTFRSILERLADTDIAALRFSALNRLAGQEEYWRKCHVAGGEAFLEYEEAAPEDVDKDDSLKKSIITDKTLPYYVSPRRVATDAVAFSDGKGLPWYVARTSSEQLNRIETENDPTETDWSSLAVLRRELRERPLESPDEIYITILKIREALFPEGKAVTSEFLTQEYSGMSKILDGRQWQEFSLLENEREHMREEDWKRPRKLRDTDTEELRSILEGDAESADESLDSLFRPDRENEERETVAQERIDRILDDIFAHMETFRTDTLSYLDRKLSSAEESGKLVEAHLTDYEHLAKDPALSPFGGIDAESLRIIRNLHAPDGKEFLGMDFSRLPLRAQIHFLSFRGKEKTSDAERFRLALEKHKAIADDLAYSFLATAEGREYGETILTLAERLDTETLGPILQKYAEIAQDTDTIADYVRESFPNLGSEELEREAIAISKNLLRRGRDLLVEFSRSTDADPETLLRRLDEAQTDAILYKTAFRTLHESGSKAGLAEMMKSEIVSLHGTELDTKTEKTLLRIYDRNYPESDQYPAGFRKKIFDGLRSAFRNPDSRFYLLMREENIIGFRRFDANGETENGKPRKYAGSFNIDPAYRDSKIGDVFYQVTLEQEGRGSVIEANVDPQVPVSSFYVERYGYVIDGVTEIEGKPFLTMRRDLKANGSFATRDTAFDESISDISKHVSEINERLSSICAFAIDRTELFDLVQAKTKEGWTLTRLPYGEGGRDGGKVIAIFENPSLRTRVTNVTAKETVSEAA